MRRTNKRNKIKKRRKTIKKRFSKRGGTRTCCKFCNKCFEDKSIYGITYENHIKIHPICVYCGKQVKDKTDLVKHIIKDHRDYYNIAESIKFAENNNPSLVNKLLEDENMTVSEFFTRVQNKKEKEEKKELEKRKKEETARVEEDKKLAKEIAKKEEAANRLAREIAKKEKEEAEKAKIEAEKERQRLARETAAAKKQEQIKKEQQEKLERELEVKTMGMEDRRAKGIEKNIRRELTAMNKEDELSKQLQIQEQEEIANNLQSANTVEDAIEIIESAAEPTVSTAPIQNINLRSMLSIDEFSIIKSGNFQRDITRNMTSLFPVTKCVSKEIIELTNKKTRYNPYKFINNLIIFLVGLFNYKFIENNIDIRMIIKGGKGAQMILSTYDFYNLSNGDQVKCDIISDDVDILLVQENGYNRETLYSVAKQFANLVKSFVDELYTQNPLISIREPIPDAFNPNIFKISYINTTEPNKIKYNVVSDIDFKQVESDFFDMDNLIGVDYQYSYGSYDDYTFYLTYLLQSPQAFLAEKQYYLSIYDNIMQKSSTIKDKICDCNNIIEEGNSGFDYDCYMTCKARERMIPKFQKYITPFQQLVDRLSDNSNFAGHY